MEHVHAAYYDIVRTENMCAEKCNVCTEDDIVSTASACTANVRTEIILAIRPYLQERDQRKSLFV